jgi:hypothetical protein
MLIRIPNKNTQGNIIAIILSEPLDVVVATGFQPKPKGFFGKVFGRIINWILAVDIYEVNINVGIDAAFATAMALLRDEQTLEK